MEKAVVEAVKASLTYKIQKQVRLEVMGERLTELKISGEPWCEDMDSTSVPSRQQLLLNMFQQINHKSGSQWRFLAVTNIKGLNDSIFFIQVQCCITMDCQMCQ